MTASADVLMDICDTLRGCGVIETRNFRTHDGTTVLGWLLVDGRFLVIYRKGRIFVSFRHYERGDFNTVMENTFRDEASVIRDLFE